MKEIGYHLNQMQMEAVLHTEGPLLILAGAGSGKTRVLMHRIAYLMEKRGVSPYHIMAITFTNKAAKEMRERIDSLVGEEADSIWVSTFHASCVRMLRRFIDRIGYDNQFSIYDADDQKTLMKKIFKELNIDNKQIRERNALHAISSYKNELRDAQEAEKTASDYYEKKIAEIYGAYQEALKKNNALDFDDLIGKTVELFEKNPDVLSHYQERFRYIMVDEYQDTNTAQFRLIKLLAGKHKNLCVVGDDDQSIYKFRGANIRNILEFEKVFPDTRVIKLEQNYRSSGYILDAANKLIANNRQRKTKTLWTAQEGGQKAEFRQFEDAKAEADAIARDIIRHAKCGNYNDFAVLYRTNAQSRLLEERCVSLGIPYQLVGGVNFYQRKEIKDIIAYLKTIANGRDDIALLRIINIPKRGVGESSLVKLSSFASEHGISLYEACLNIWQIPELKRALDKIKSFTDLIEGFRKRLKEGAFVSDIIRAILEEAEYEAYLEQEGEIEAQSRLENIYELINKAEEFREGGLGDFLEEIALIADIDRMDSSASRITLMTIHAAKGLEFDQVYMIGMEDGLFPSSISINADDAAEIEEERRLCYVGITRAKKRLVFTAARTRVYQGDLRYCEVSRFMEEIPKELLEGSIAPKPLKKSAESFSDGKGEERARLFFKQKPAAMPLFGREFVVNKAKELDYQKGDRVKHIKFGEGRVLEIREGTKDFEVSVEFDHFGVKKMFAAFAKLEKI